MGIKPKSPGSVATVSNNVTIKKLEMALGGKNNGAEFKAMGNRRHVGDLYVTKTELNWCKGKKQPKNGIKIKWGDLIKLVEQYATTKG